MSLEGRNKEGLSEHQIQLCLDAWALLCGEDLVELDVSRAHMYQSKTRWNEVSQKVFLGANVLSGVGLKANYRLSMLACLAHELAHARRYHLGFSRPFALPDSLLDEAETSLHASFTSVLSQKDRADLVEEARDRTMDWLALKAKEGLLI